MDKQGHIYDPDQISMPPDPDRREQYKRIMEQDKTRLEGYLKGRAEAEQKQAEAELKKRCDSGEEAVTEIIPPEGR